jgi:hypothetical protein
MPSSANIRANPDQRGRDAGTLTASRILERNAVSAARCRSRLRCRCSPRTHLTKAA